MLSSVTYKSGSVKSDFGFEFPNSVSKVNINKKGCASPPNNLLLPGSQLKNVNLVSFISTFPFSDRYTLILKFPNGSNREQVVSLQLSE